MYCSYIYVIICYKSLTQAWRLKSLKHENTKSVMLHNIHTLANTLRTSLANSLEQISRWKILPLFETQAPNNYKWRQRKTEENVNY